MSNIPWFQIAQNVINLAQTADEYSVAKAKAKAMKKQQEYNNKMARISDALNQNAITSNVSMAIQQSARQAQQIQQQGGAMRSAITTSAGSVSVNELCSIPIDVEVKWSNKYAVAFGI